MPGFKNWSKVMSNVQSQAVNKIVSMTKTLVQVPQTALQAVSHAAQAVNAYVPSFMRQLITNIGGQAGTVLTDVLLMTLPAPLRELATSMGRQAKKALGDIF